MLGACWYEDNDDSEGLGVPRPFGVVDTDCGVNDEESDETLDRLSEDFAGGGGNGTRVRSR